MPAEPLRDDRGRITVNDHAHRQGERRAADDIQERVLLDKQRGEADQDRQNDGTVPQACSRRE